jgi:hypothetical protein
MPPRSRPLLALSVIVAVAMHTFPQQELPASVYAIRGLRPRMLLTLGVAF